MIIRGCSTFAQPELSLHVIEAEDLSASKAMASRCRSNTGAYRRMPREACFVAWAILPAISLALAQRNELCYTIGKVWGLSSRRGHSSDGGKGPPHYQVH
jgi:hypothetical protein